jgi:hypothetical protein
MKKGVIFGFISLILAFSMLVIACKVTLDPNIDEGHWVEALTDPPVISTNVWIWAKNNTLTATVETDNVIAIIIGTASTNFFDAHVAFNYHWEEGKVYMYELEACTDSETRTLNSYYNGGPQNTPVTITTERQIFTIPGTYPSLEQDKSFYIQCGDKAGKFYVRMVSIRTLER